MHHTCSTLGSGQVPLLYQPPGLLDVTVASDLLVIDAADPAHAPLRDVDWSPRPGDGDSSGTPEPDVGASEYDGTS